jgi:hypothetical protein
MRKVIASLIGVTVLVVASAGLARPLASTARADGQTVLEFETMAPVSGAFVGTTLIRGVPGGGAPWVISAGQGSVDTDGNLEVQVTGLVLAPSVPAPFGGTNPVPNFKGIVSCLNSDGTTTNVSTGAFPASSNGNAEIQAKVDLPNPCFAPIIFVAASFGPWFAVTGR